MSRGPSEGDRERPYVGGSQPVREHPPEVPVPGHSVVQTAVLIVAVLAVVAALLWLVVPLSG